MNYEIAEGEDATSYVEEEDEEDVSAEFSGTEDDSSDDDFEFKDLEKEIYGRLGGPPPELQLAIGKAVEKEKDSKSSSNKDKKQATKAKEVPPKNRAPLQEITSKENEKVVTENDEAKREQENVAPSESPLEKPIAVTETPKMKLAETKEMSVIKNTIPTNQPSTNKERTAVNAMDENEAPKDDCGCTIM